MKSQIHFNSPVVRTFTWIPAIAAVLLAAQADSWGQIIYKTGFESPSMVAGPLAGQDGWIAPPPLSPDAAVVTTDKPRMGRQTVRVQGGDLVHQDFIGAVTGGYYDAIGSYRHAVNYDTGGTEAVCVSANVRVDGALTPAGNNFFSASIAALANDSQGDPSGVGELAISSDGHVYGYSSQDLVPTFLTSAPVTLGEWHHLAVIADFAARTYSFFVDEEWLGTFAFDPSADTNIFRRGSMVAYAAPDSGPLTKSDYSAHFDNFKIQALGVDDAD